MSITHGAHGHGLARGIERVLVLKTLVDLEASMAMDSLREGASRIAKDEGVTLKVY